MPETYEEITVATEQTLPRIVWKRFRRPMPDIVERTLATNRHLADAGLLLPRGTKFKLVIPGPEEDQPIVPVVRLWGTS